MADMKVSQEKLDKIRAFVTRGRDAEEEYNRSPLSSDAVQQYNKRLDDTIQSLQEHVKRQEDALRKVCPHYIPFKKWERKRKKKKIKRGCALF